MLLTAAGVAFELGTSIATVWRWHASDPTFPRSFKLGENCTRWNRSEVESWAAAQAAQCAAPKAVPRGPGRPRKAAAAAMGGN